MGGRLGAALIAEYWQRTDPVRGPNHEVESQPDDRFDADEIDQMGVVAGPVVLVVQAGVKHDGRNPGRDERVVIRVVGDLPVEHQFQVRFGIRRHDRATERLGRAGTVDLDPLPSQSANHVEIQREDDLPLGNRRGTHPEEVVGTQQTLLLPVPKRDQHRSPRPARQLAEGLGQFDQSGDTRGVVVGAVVNQTGGAEAIVGCSVADVVVVGADDDHLAGDGRIAARQEGEDVPHAAERLEETAVVSRWLEPQSLDGLNDVGAGGTPAPTAPLAALEGIVGKGMDVPAGVRRPDARMGRMEPLGGERGGPWTGARNPDNHRRHNEGTNHHGGGGLLAGPGFTVQNRPSPGSPSPWGSAGSGEVAEWSNARLC